MVHHHPTAVNDSINVGDYYWYTSGVRLSIAGGAYFDSAACSGPFAFSVDPDFTSSGSITGSSGIREYSSMSSQVPATANGKVSDIAFESSYPYSLHPTATNGSINVGDYYYGSGVRSICGSGGYRYGAECGYLHFAADNSLTFSRNDFGSSGYIQKYDNYRH